MNDQAGIRVSGEQGAMLVLRTYKKPARAVAHSTSHEDTSVQFDILSTTQRNVSANLVNKTHLSRTAMSASDTSLAYRIE